MDELITEVQRLRALIDLAEKEGLEVPTLSDVNAIMQDAAIPDAEKLRWAKSLSRLIHELLYAPPRGNR